MLACHELAGVRVREEGSVRRVFSDDERVFSSPRSRPLFPFSFRVRNARFAYALRNNAKTPLPRMPLELFLLLCAQLGLSESEQSMQNIRAMRARILTGKSGVFAG